MTLLIYSIDGDVDWDGGACAIDCDELKETMAMHGQLYLYTCVASTQSMSSYSLLGTRPLCYLLCGNHSS